MDPQMIAGFLESLGTYKFVPWPGLDINKLMWQINEFNSDLELYLLEQSEMEKAQGSYTLVAA